MNRLRSSLVTILFVTASIAAPKMFAQNVANDQAYASRHDEESAVKATVDTFLVALGKGDLEKVKTLFLPNANIASVSMSDGKTTVYSISAEQYISQREGKENRTFREPVREYTVNISQGMLAFVRADATVYYDGNASHHTNDFFILMKEDDVWKILSGSYTSHPLETE